MGSPGFWEAALPEQPQKLLLVVAPLSRTMGPQVGTDGAGKNEPKEHNPLGAAFWFVSVYTISSQHNYTAKKRESS